MRRRTGRASSPTGSPPSSASSTSCTGRTRRASGRAYLAGFERALADDAELILEMDCDFSHDPADVPRLIAAAEDGADLVLGSRYVPGGRVENWGLVRRAISRGASVYTALFLHMGVRDPTGGFKCFRRARARDDPARRDPRAGLRVSDRDDVPRASGPASASSRCRSPSPTGPPATRR